MKNQRTLHNAVNAISNLRRKAVTVASKERPKDGSQVLLRRHDGGEGTKQTLSALTHQERTSSRIESSHILHVHQLFAEAKVRSVENCAISHVLGQQGNSVLGTISLNLGQRQIINEDDKAFRRWGTVAATRSLVNR